MYKYFFLFFFIKLFSLEVVVNTTNDYSVLTMTNNKKFICKQKDEKTYICRFSTLPSTPVFSTNTVDFKLFPFFDKNIFYMKIITKNSSFIKSFKKNLYEGYDKRLKNLIQAKKWVIISYKKKVPFLSDKPVTGLKFPLEVDTDFYLKAIDANGNPVDYDTQTADVIDYFSILAKYNKHNLSIDRVDEFLQNYPNSIFLPDILYLKLKLLDEEAKPDEIIKIGNSWIKKYAFNEHLPEVLLLLAKNYSNNGMMEDATYMYERLFTEYDGSRYAYEGMVYLADQLYSAGDNKRAFQLYQNALTNTKDKQVALLAASRIAQRYLDEGNIKQSVKYYDKVLKASEDYLLQDKQQAYELANQLAKHNAYKVAIKIVEGILKKIGVDDNLYEPILYRLAKWNYELHNYKKTQKFVNIYLDKMPYGDFADQMKSLNDKVLFEVNDNNSTMMLSRYNKIIEKYKDTPLAKKALIKKLQLLYRLKKYEQVLELSKGFDDVNKTIVKNSVLNVVKKSLSNSCNKAIKYYHEYNLSLPNSYDESLYRCAYKVRDFRTASIVCNRYILDSNRKIALKWLINKAKVFEATRKDKELVLIIDDICNLMKKGCYKWRYKQFFAYYRLNNSDKFLQIASKLLKKDNVKNIDIFMKVVSYAKNQNNTLLVYTYSKKILELQQKYHIFVQSPYIDFTFVDSAKKLDKKDEAIKVLKHLVTLKIDEDKKARAYYLLGSMTKKRVYLEKCIKLKKSQTWMPLCKDSLELY